MKIDNLREKFLSDFGVKKEDTRIGVKATPPITINGTEWVFGLRKIESSGDSVWVSLNVEFSLGTSIGNEIVNDMEMSKTMMALAVCSVNEIPTFKMVGVEVSDDQVSSITDFNNPPDGIKFAAASLFLNMLSKMEEGPAIVTFLKMQYESMFPKRITFGIRPEAPEHSQFHCPDCHYVTIVKPEDMDRLSSVVEEKGGLSCLSCGTIATEKKNEEEETSPLDLPGIGS